MTIFWGIAFLAFIILEMATVSITSIWFAAGALTALAAAALGGPIWLQIVCFAAVTALTLILIRPAARKYISRHNKPTNADRLLEMTGEVTEDIDNIRCSGAVTVGGQIWTARSENGEAITAGTLVRPVRIEGSKLVVRKTEKVTAPDKA